MTDSKRFTRSRHDRILVGVCGGLGHYFGLDPIYFRLAFLLATLPLVFGPVVYLVLWMIMPEDPVR